MQIAKQATLTFITKIISFIFSLIGSIYMTRLLGVEGQGVYGFIKTNVVFFTMLFGFNMLQVLTYFVANEKIDSKKIRGLCVLLKFSAIILYTLIVAVLYLTESSFLNFLLPRDYQSSFYVIYILVLYLNTSTLPFYHGNWQGQAKFELINILLLISSFLHAVLFTFCWYYSKNQGIKIEIEDVLLISLFISVILFIIRSVLFFTSGNTVSFNFKSIVKPVLIFSLMGWITSVFNFGLKRIDIWFVERYKGLEELGFYSLAGNLVDILITLVLPVTFVISPYLTKSTKKRQFHVLSKFSRITILVMILVTGFAILCLPIFVPLLYGDEFINSIYSAQILFLGGLFIIIRNIFSVYNIATDNLRPNLIATFVGFIFTLIFDYFVVPKYGIIGASWVSTTAYFISSLIVIISVIKGSNQSIKSFFIITKEDIEYLILKSKGILNKYGIIK